MEIEKAKKEVDNIGAAYFYDDLDRFTIDQIINRLVSEILQAKKLKGLLYSEVTRDAFYQILNELSQEELDVMLESFGLCPEQVGGSRAFFQQLATEMDKAIKEVKSKLSE
jgi:hypothetical protein